jgi:hypothetical protein
LSAPRHVFAIDFGTCNSYFCRCASDEPAPDPIQFGGGRYPVASVVLYRRDAEPIVGDAAVEEWGDSLPEERAGYDIHFNFKSDIVASADARKTAADFFSGVLALAKKSHLAFSPEESEVIIGVPSEAGDDFVKCLKEIAKEAGYGDIKTMDEPVGALLHHLRLRDIAPSDALRGNLVVDFGGGTCDFAYMSRLEVKHSWGDMLLGGRLFDDLFFQWFLDLNPGAFEKLEADGYTFYYLWQTCRELKEKFSKTMERDRAATVGSAMGQGGYGAVRGLTWDEFRGRAAKYAPSEPLRKYLLDRLGSEEAKKLAGETVDLVEWFSRTLKDGMEKHSIASSDISRVFLAGGSSSWPFVVEILKEALHIDDSRIVRSNRPFAAISEGLAVLPALRLRTDAARRKLKNSLEPFIKELAEEDIAGRIDETVAALKSEMETTLIDGEIRPVLREFREKGGSIKGAIEKPVEERILNFEPKLKEIAASHLNRLTCALPGEIESRIEAWFEENSVRYLPSPVERTIEGVDGSLIPEGAAKAMSDFHSAILNWCEVIVTSTVSALVGSICGGAGMAILASGPAGWLAGAVLSLITLGVLTHYGFSKAKRKLKRWELSPSNASLLLSEGRQNKVLEQAKADLGKHIEETLGDALAEFKSNLERQVREHVEKEIEALSELNQL